MNLHRFDADPDQAFCFDAHPDPKPQYSRLDTVLFFLFSLVQENGNVSFMRTGKNSLIWTANGLVSCRCQNRIVLVHIVKTVK